MDRRRHGPLAVGAVALAGLLSNVPVVATESSAPLARDYVAPTVEPVDTGVFDVYYDGPASDYEFDELPHLPVFDPAIAISMRLESCKVRAPGLLTVAGFIDLPPGVTETRVGVFLSGGAYVKANVRGEGAFAFDSTAARETQPRETQPRETQPRETQPRETQPRETQRCDAQIEGADHPYLSGNAEAVPLEFRRRPLWWPAPRGSIQALGRGVVLSDPDDARQAWALHTWADRTLPFRRVFVAPPTAFPLQWVGTEGTPAHPCVQTTFYATTGYTITQTSRCFDTDLGLEVAGASEVEGFSEGRRIGKRVLVARRPGVTIIIAGTRRAGRSAIARAIRPYRNLRFEAANRPAPDATLEEVVGLALAQRPGLTERTRFVTDNSVTLFLTGEETPHLEGSDDDTRVSSVGHVSLRPHGTTWAAGYFAVSQGAEFCLYRGGIDSVLRRRSSVTPDPAAQYFVANDPTWTIQGRQVDGTIDTLTSDKGVVVIPDPDNNPETYNQPYAAYRVLDGDGRPIRCNEGEWRDPGETWSDWTPPTARWDLPITITEQTLDTEGLLVQLSARGFFANSSVHTSICSDVRDAWWPTGRCAGWGGTLSDARGRVTAGVGYLRSSLFDPFDGGGPFDCRRVRCVIRLEGNGLTRRAEIRLRWPSS